jgi:DNA-binding GntR family transcriptional regulator
MYVVGILREAIASGKIPSGVRIKEKPIAGQLGISRGPIRDALRVLAEDGLVELLPNRGAMVPSPVASDMLEVYALRASLGLLALRKVLKSPADVDLSLVAAQLKALSEAVANQDDAGALLADLSFQDRLVQASGMKRTSREFERLTFQLRMIISELGIRFGDHLSVIESQDCELFAAVSNGRAADAERLWKEQREYWLRDIITYLPGAGFDEDLWIALTRWAN